MHPPAPGLSADMCTGVREEGWVGDCVHILGQVSWYLCSGPGDGCGHHGGVVMGAWSSVLVTCCAQAAWRVCKGVRCSCVTAPATCVRESGCRPPGGVGRLGPVSAPRGHAG